MNQMSKNLSKVAMGLAMICGLALGEVLPYILLAVAVWGAAEAAGYRREPLPGKVTVLSEEAIGLNF